MSVRGQPTPLSMLLRQRTSSRHRLAEEAPFIRSVLCGRVREDLYARFVASLYFVYAQMEAALDLNRSHPFVAPLDLPGLRRVPSLEIDMDWWCGPTWRVSTLPSPATRTYRDRIREIAGTSPSLLVGHLYTRYLGDLSGGQLLGRAVERAFGLAHGDGVSFHRFGSPEHRALLKERFRGRLDALPVDTAVAEQIIAEACRAFDLNRQLFDELDPAE